MRFNYNRMLFVLLLPVDQKFYAFYFVSAWLDAVDGHVARLYGQSKWVLCSHRNASIVIVFVFLKKNFC
jgi:hypothetical protein